VSVDWWTSGGAYISTFTGTPISIAAGTWTQIQTATTLAAAVQRGVCRHDRD
jgi:hypothetical protein